MQAEIISEYLPSLLSLIEILIKVIAGIVTICGVIVAAGWVYLLKCVNKITKTYELRTEFAKEQLQLNRDNIVTMHDVLKSIKEHAEVIQYEMHRLRAEVNILKQEKATISLDKFNLEKEIQQLREELETAKKNRYDLNKLFPIET